MGGVNWSWFFTTMMPVAFVILLVASLSVTAIHDICYKIIERIRRHPRHQ